MIAHTIFFYFFSFIAIVSAIMVTASRNTVHSVFFLILDFISISCLFIMIGAEFLGMIMLIVYVGAVAVLFLFVVMMLNVAEQKNEWFSSSQSSAHIPIGLLVSLIIFFEVRTGEKHVTGASQWHGPHILRVIFPPVLSLCDSEATPLALWTDAVI